MNQNTYYQPNFINQKIFFGHRKIFVVHVWWDQPNILLSVWLQRLFIFCDAQTMFFTFDVSLSFSHNNF